MLGVGLALALATAAWQYFSPASGEILSGRDVRVALLGPDSSALLVYHPFSGTVNAFSDKRRPRRGAKPDDRAAELAGAAGAGGGKVFYVELSTAPDLNVLWNVLNGWRSNPRLLLSAAAWTRGVKDSGMTDLSSFDLFSLFSEFSGLGSSDFILTDVRRGTEQDGEAVDDSRLPMVEVLNASGKDGLAGLAAKYLRGKGFDVISVGNSAKRKRTEIYGFSEDAAAALGLRAALGLDELEIHLRPTHRSVAAAEVVLGEDFETGKLKK